MPIFFFKSGLAPRRPHLFELGYVDRSKRPESPPLWQLQGRIPLAALALQATRGASCRCRHSGWLGSGKSAGGDHNPSVGPWKGPGILALWLDHTGGSPRHPVVGGFPIGALPEPARHLAVTVSDRFGLDAHLLLHPLEGAERSLRRAPKPSMVKSTLPPCSSNGSFNHFSAALASFAGRPDLTAARSSADRSSTPSRRVPRGMPRSS